MNYMKEIDAWLNGEIHELYLAMLKKPFDQEMAAVVSFKKAVKDKILESYRNGQRSKRSVRKPASAPKEQ